MYPDLKVFYPKNSWQFLRHLCACRNQSFFIFPNILNFKEYLKWEGRFQVLLSTIFYKKSSMKPSWLGSSLTCNIFSKKSWFLCSDKPHKKWGRHCLLILHYQKRNKISEWARLITHLKTWAQLQVFLKNLASNFQTTFFTEHISVAASWNYVIVSRLSSRGTQRLWNTFESASFTLSTKSVVRFGHCSALVALTIWWIITHEH